MKRVGVWLVLLGMASSLLASPSQAGGVRDQSDDVQVAQGTVGSYFWALSIHRGQGMLGGVRPCLIAGLASGQLRSSGSRLTLCGLIEGSQILVANSIGDGAAERTVLGMAFRSDVVEVRLLLHGQRVKKLQLSLLSPLQAKRARVRQFRYAAIGVGGPYCLKGFSAYDATHRLVVHRARLGCGR
jgi:hypothetical protein